MSDIWSSLGKARLQELIGEGVLSRLEVLLPAVDPSFDQAAIYTRDGLSKVFDSFAGAGALDKTGFRTELFNSLSPERLESLIQKIAPQQVHAEWAQKVKVVAGGWANRETAQTIAEELAISKEFLPQDFILPPSEVVLPAAEALYKPLKDYQSGIFFHACDKLLVDRTRFILQMPTGSGKTRTAIEIITHFLNSHRPGSVVLWMVHSEELCEQAYECFRQIWPHVSQKEVRLARCWGDGGVLPFEFPESGFIVGSFARLHAMLKKVPKTFSEIANRVGLLVVDEAHKVLAPTYQVVVNALVGPSTRVIGLTATPGRSVSDQEENKALAEFFFSDIISVESGTIPVIDYLRAKGVLSETEYVPLKTGRSYDLSDRDKSYLERFFDLPPGLLHRLGNDDVRNVEIVKRLERECKDGGQIIFFACSVDHSKFICALLNFLGIHAAHVDGTTSRSRRQALINDFKESRVQVLCNYGLLSTGFDAPKTNVVFIARPTGSIVLYSQMIGRGLRGPAIGGTERCRVIDVIDNIAGFSDERSVYDYFADYYSTIREA